MTQMGFVTMVLLAPANMEEKKFTAIGYRTIGRTLWSAEVIIADFVQV